MSENGENEGECGDDDEWGDLISAPNRLISDEFCVFMPEKMNNRVEGDEEKGKEEQDQESRVCSDGRGIAERRTAKSGYNDNASRISVSVYSSPVTAWSQFLAIPSGISPTSLLESPIMLPNSQGSPTTGSLPFPPLNHEIVGTNSAVDDRSRDTGFSTYQPHGSSLLWPCFPGLQNQPPELSEFPEALLKQTVTKGDDNQTSRVIQSTEGDDTKRHLHERYQKETSLSNMRNSEDGYNWRKYGQKQVKGSEYPRSYYKCTHPNCTVKKKVERSHDGQITEIIYKGSHNHQVLRNIIGSHIKIEEGEACGNIYQGGTNNIVIRPDWTPDGTELSSSTSVVTDNSDLISRTQGKSMGTFESAGNPDPDRSYLNANYDVNEEDEDKSELKRRKKGNFSLDTNMVTRAMREPRVVVQIESEVDILDDGYRWRKYGQKVVKGNPNPRSYYKCTSTGCPVRKHVERASDDLKSVLTTYEGKHNHEVPAARNSSHANMDVGSASNAPNLTLTRIANVPKAEPSNLVTNFDTGPTKFEASSIYQTKYVPFQSPMSYNSVIPDFPISLPMTIPPSSNVVCAGFGFNNNGKRGREDRSFVGWQGRDNNGRFLKPKLEQEDGFYDTFPHGPDRVNDASSRYYRVFPNFPS